jgi:hypothetical protein
MRPLALHVATAAAPAASSVSLRILAAEQHQPTLIRIECPRMLDTRSRSNFLQLLPLTASALPGVPLHCSVDCSPTVQKQRRASRLRDRVFSARDVGTQPELGLGGHQLARPRLPGADLQPLVEVVLVGTRHPLGSQVAQVGRNVVSDAGGPEAGRDTAAVGLACPAEPDRAEPNSANTTTRPSSSPLSPSGRRSTRTARRWIGLRPCESPA